MKPDLVTLMGRNAKEWGPRTSRVWDLEPEPEDVKGHYEDMAWRDRAILRMGQFVSEAHQFLDETICTFDRDVAFDMIREARVLRRALMGLEDGDFVPYIAKVQGLCERFSKLVSPSSLIPLFDSDLDA